MKLLFLLSAVDPQTRAVILSSKQPLNLPQLHFQAQHKLRRRHTQGIVFLSVVVSLCS